MVINLSIWRGLKVKGNVNKWSVDYLNDSKISVLNGRNFCQRNCQVGSVIFYKSANSISEMLKQGGKSMYEVKRCYHQVEIAE